MDFLRCRIWAFSACGSLQWQLQQKLGVFEEVICATSEKMVFLLDGSREKMRSIAEIRKFVDAKLCDFL